MTNDQAPVTNEDETPVSDENAAPEADQPHAPHIQVLKGSPTDAEVAALVAVLGSAVGRRRTAETGVLPVGNAGRQIALLDPQLAAHEPAATDAHAGQMTQASDDDDAGVAGIEEWE